MNTTVLAFLLLTPANPDYWSIGLSPSQGMTNAEAEQQASEWFGTIGRPPYSWRQDGRCCVGGNEAVGSGQTWKKAFLDARRHGWDPAAGYDWTRFVDSP